MIIGSVIILLIIFITGCSDLNSNQNSTHLDEENKQLHEEKDTHSYEDLPYENVSENELNALKLTLDDEYKAEAIYQKVIDKFGEVKPFSNIIFAEQKHSKSLIEIFNKYELEYDQNDLYDKIPEFDSVHDACIAGVQAEIENIALYDELFKDIDNEDITAVFIALRDASKFKHLPAFEKCVARG